MIRSKLMTDEFEVTAEPVADALSSRDFWSLILSIFLVGIITWIIHPKNILPLDLFLWQPIMALATFALMGIWFKFWYKTNLTEVWNLIKVNSPVALVGGLCFGLLGLWPQTSGSLPLTIGQIPAYFFTLGFWPLIAGPIAILRGLVLGFAISVFWKEFKAQHNDIRAVAGGLGTWLAGSFALILPSIIVTLTAAFSGRGLMHATGTDLIGAFSRSNLNTYWSNAQLTRWFTGFGGELPNMITLFTASWTLLIVICSLLIVFWRPKDLMQKIKLQIADGLNNLFYLSAVLSGLSVGWGKMRGSNLDLAAYLVFMMTLVLWHLVTNVTTRTDDQSDVSRSGFWRSGYQLLLVLFAGLMGWSVLLPVILGLIVVWLYEKNYLTTPLLKGGKGVLSAVLWLALAAASLSFIRGAQPVSDAMTVNLLAFGGIVLVAVIARNLIERSEQKVIWQSHTWLITSILWLIASLCTSYVLDTFLPAALALLCIALGHIWYKIKGDLSRWIPQIILLYMAVVLVFAFWLPRWLNPRLLPL